MLSVKNLINKIRETTYDTETKTNSDENILKCINGGILFLRRVIKEFKPLLIADSPITGTLKIGQSKVDLDNIPTKFLCVRINGKIISSIHLVDIYDINRTGEPCKYYQTGLKTINFYPIPDREFDYQIVVISDFKELTLEDSSPFPNEFDDFLVEYSIIRLSVGNEFNMSDEAQIMSEIIEQIKINLLNSEPRTNHVKGYFDAINDDCCARGGW